MKKYKIEVKKIYSVPEKKLIEILYLTVGKKVYMIDWSKKELQVSKKLTRKEENKKIKCLYYYAEL